MIFYAELALGLISLNPDYWIDLGWTQRNPPWSRRTKILCKEKKVWMLEPLLEGRCWELLDFF